jgi:hypothetical protein
MIPRAKTAIWVRAPPENRLMNWNTPPWAPAAKSCAACTSMPGVGTWDPNR